jgi:iron(III) transport system substrate-binding protein
MKKNLTIALFSFFLISAFAACSAKPLPAPVEKQIVVEKEVIKEVKVPGETIIVEKEVEVDKKEKGLVIYSGRSESLVGPIIEEFSVLSGIPVEVKYGKSGAMTSLLQEEGSKTPADVFYAQDPGNLGAVSDMLTPMSREVCNLIPVWAVGPRAADNSCKWIGITGRARVLVYNPNTTAEADLPTSMEDLTNPKYKGKLGWAPTNGSFQAMVTGMRIYWGEEKTKVWLEGIMANEPIVYPKNTPQVQAAADDEIEFGMVNHYYLHRFIADKGENFAARNHYLDNGDIGSVVLVSGAGILDASDNKNNAERFITFMTSKIAQQYFATQVHEYPLITDGVTPNRLLRDMENLNKPDLDISQLGDLENTQALLIEVGALQ